MMFYQIHEVFKNHMNLYDLRAPSGSANSSGEGSPLRFDHFIKSCSKIIWIYMICAHPAVPPIHPVREALCVLIILSCSCSKIIWKHIILAHRKNSKMSLAVKTEGFWTLYHVHVQKSYENISFFEMEWIRTKHIYTKEYENLSFSNLYTLSV